MTIAVQYQCPICGESGERQKTRLKVVTCGKKECVKQHKINKRKELNKFYSQTKRPFPSDSKKYPPKMGKCLCGKKVNKGVVACRDCKTAIRNAKLLLDQESREARSEQKTQTKQCAECGRVFQTKKPNRTYCDVTCSRRAAKRRWAEKLRVDEYRAKTLAKNREYNRARYTACPVSNTIRSQISRTISRGFSDVAKNWKTFEMLGYSPSELMGHLESLFLFGMSWKNYGEWHIDHIKPISMHRLKNQDDFKRCWSLKNLKPRWATTAIANKYGGFEEGNVNKGGRYVG
jgi:hypothetical protein